MIAALKRLLTPAEPDPYGIEASLAFRKQCRLLGLTQPYKRRGR